MGLFTFTLRNAILDKFPVIINNYTMILTIEVIRDGAFTLLSDMERLDLIRISASYLPNLGTQVQCHTGKRSYSQYFHHKFEINN